MSTARRSCPRTPKCESCAPPPEPESEAHVDVFVVQLLTGLAGASSLFLLAAGLTVIFGVTRVVNFAHGSLYMLGAYTGWTVLSALPRTPVSFAIGAVLAGAAVALLGAAIEVT